jgi:hypothetical protein
MEREEVDGNGWYHHSYPPRPDGIMPRPAVGDVVWLQVKVLKVFPGDELGYEVALFSKTDEYSAVVRPDHVVRVVRAPKIPPEPVFGTYLLHLPLPGEDEGQMTVFAHIGLGGGRPWRDVAAQQNITWEEAYLRGARPVDANIITAPPPPPRPKLYRGITDLTPSQRSEP